MSPERPTRVVGRCIVCGDMIVEVADVSTGSGSGFRVESRILRRCGCGDWHPANANVAERNDRG